ncbi:MAG: Ig-like domain-containing protein [Porphyromonas sp.]|nr:Ig-like domain-containing protein [Porphyromonas sp.]
MKHLRISLFEFFLLTIAVVAVLLSSCAHRIPPGGGPYDDVPPRLIRSTPELLALHVESKRIVLNFDEYVKLEDMTSKVIISPPQLQQPKIMAVGKRIVVELEDDLLPNTTYTIDFTDAIVDNNEGNALENFSFAFSTGAEIDTMEISGKVLDARTLEPVQGVTVGIHPDYAGSEAFTDTTFLRMSRTSDRAIFILRNVKQGTYSAYALKESDGNYRYNMQTEGIAFLDSLITTRSEAATRMDTTWVDSLTIDTVQLVHYTRFLPDDIVLRFFQPEVQQRHITKRERPSAMKLRLTFNTLPVEHPLIQPVDSLLPTFPDSIRAQNYVLDYDVNGSIIDVYLKDSLWADVSRFEVAYLTVDSLLQSYLQRDTIQLSLRKNKEESASSSSPEEDEDKPRSPFSVQVSHKGDGGVGDSIIFTTTLPIDTSALAGIQLFNANDSILVPVEISSISMLSKRTTMGMIKAPLKYNTAYELYFDSLAFVDIYGNRLDETVVDAFKTKAREEFSHLEIVLQWHDNTPYIVELLDSSDKPIRVGLSERGESVKFRDLMPGKYGFRVIIDRNGNGKWDTGNYDTKTQPEEVYYSPKIIELMKNWEVKENFDPLLVPLDQQKPAELIKNKPKEKKKRDLNKEREEELRNRQQGVGQGVGGFGGMGGAGGMRPQRGVGLF